MVQVQNEPGTYGSVRDFGAEATKLFAGAVPAALVKAQGAKPGTWSQVFGKDADEFFHAWSVAKFIGEVAAAGKKEYPLPDVRERRAARSVPSRCAGWLCQRRSDRQRHLYLPCRGAGHRHRRARHLHEGVERRSYRVIELYKPGGPLLVPEIGNDPLFARYFYDVLGAQAIGIVPFGMDYTGYSNFPLGAKDIDEAIDAFARPYRLLAPMAREWARLSFTNKVWGASEPDDRASRKLDLGRWTGHVELQRMAVRHEGVVWRSEGQARVVGLSFRRRVAGAARSR